MAVNRGKQFEEIIRNCFERVPNTSVIRLYDTMNGYKTVANPCDFVVYNYPHQYLIECKCCHGASLPIKNITDFQWESLIKLENIKGVVAGYLIWFIDKDVTVFIPANNLDIYVKQTGRESFSYKDVEEYGYILSANKKRTFFDYNMEDFFRNVSNGQTD